MKFRVWNKDDESYIYFNGIFNNRPFIERSSFPQYESVKQYNDLGPIERCIGLEDQNEIEGYDGDLRMYHGKMYKVVDHNWCFILERNLVQFRENKRIDIGEDVMYESELVGNIHRNHDLLFKPTGKTK